MTTKDRPILFSGPMVRAILDGRKTQTRRVVKGAVFQICQCGESWPGVCDRHGPPRIATTASCPYGQPGDRLWVRETWRVPGDSSVEKASTSRCTGPDDCEFAADFDGFDLDVRTWRPSIHMPRWASRITLEVVRVRVERVQEISEADAIAEGRCLTPGDERGYFPETWDAINKARGFGWDANPWVWVVEFKRVNP